MGVKRPVIIFNNKPELGSNALAVWLHRAIGSPQPTVLLAVATLVEMQALWEEPLKMDRLCAQMNAIVNGSSGVSDETLLGLKQ